MENQQSIDKLQENLKACANSLSKNMSSSSHSFNKLTFGQGRLAKLMNKEKKKKI